MLDFSYDKIANEIMEMINEGSLDTEIQEYYKELIEDREDTNDYFDLTLLDKDGYTIVGGEIDNEQIYNNLSKLECQVHDVFQERINTIFATLL